MGRCDRVGTPRLVASSACALVLAATACTAPPPPPPASPAPAFVSVEDVRGLTGVPDLAAWDGGDDDAPLPNVNAPAPCRAVFDQQVAFGADWDSFRSATYDAPMTTGPARSLVVIGQTMATYPDSVAAQAKFDRMKAALRGCGAAKADLYDHRATHPDPSTVLLASETWDLAYRIDGSTLMTVSVTGVPDPDGVALALIARLSDLSA